MRVKCRGNLNAVMETSESEIIAQGVAIQSILINVCNDLTTVKDRVLVADWTCAAIIAVASFICKVEELHFIMYDLEWHGNSHVWLDSRQVSDWI